MLLSFLRKGVPPVFRSRAGRLRTGRLVTLAAGLMIAAGLALASPAPALADSASDALALIASPKFPDIEKGVTELAASGAPNAGAVLEAMADGRLMVSTAAKTLFIKAPDGKLLDAATGTAAAEMPADLKAVRVNNRVRRALDGAVGQLTLLSPDPAKRLSAAEAVFKSRDLTALPTVQAALAKESEPQVKAALEQAEAVLVLEDQSAGAEARRAAIGVIAARGGQDALTILSQAATHASPANKALIDEGIAAIQQKLRIAAVFQTIWYGVSLGSVLLLAAIGLAITFGVMGIINMAHGEMVMIGAYTTFVVQEVCRAWFPGLMDASLPVAIPLAFIVTGLVGAAIERTVIRHLYGRPLETLLATWGISLILQQAVRSIFGPTNRQVDAPSYMSGAFDIAGVTITYGRLWIVVFAIAVFFGLQALLRSTSFGLKMRAVTQNRKMAASMGIRTPMIDTMAFALGSGIAGIAGVALSQIDNVSPNLGQGYIVDSFMVVVFGGVGNLWGTLVSALTLGVANKILEPYAGAVLGKIIILVLLILFIQKKPRGLFALKGRAIEA